MEYFRDNLCVIERNNISYSWSVFWNKFAPFNIRAYLICNNGGDKRTVNAGKQCLDNRIWLYDYEYECYEYDYDI